jgi:hypothetical protein
MTTLMDHIEGEWDPPPLAAVGEESGARPLEARETPAKAPLGKLPSVRPAATRRAPASAGADLVRLGPEIGASLAGDRARLREALRLRHRSRATEKAYVGWVGRFLRFHGGGDPRTLQRAEIEAFLNHLATRLRVSASTQNQALNALQFFYRYVLDRQRGELSGLVRAKRPARRPVVMTS